jgi:hypothetical protein
MKELYAKGEDVKVSRLTRIAIPRANLYDDRILEDGEDYEIVFSSRFVPVTATYDESESERYGDWESAIFWAGTVEFKDASS